MKRFVFAAIILSLSLLPVKVAADLDFSKVSWKVTELDIQRFSADSLRLHYHLDEARQATAAILRTAPGDGFALREYALIARDAGELGRISTIMKRGETPPGLESVNLSDTDREMILGVIEFYRYRYISALASFQAALEKRPEWGWAKLYLARTCEQLMMPIDQWEPLFQEALADPGSAPAVFSNIMFRYPPHYLCSQQDNAFKSLKKLEPVPWLRQTVLLREAMEEILDRPRQDPEKTARRWIDLREKCPEAVLESCMFVSWPFIENLNPSEYRVFLDLISPEGGEKRQFDLISAKRLLSENDPAGGSAIIETMGDSSAIGLETMLYSANIHGTPAQIVHLTKRSLTDEASKNTISTAVWTAAALNDKELENLIEEARRDNPAADLSIRLDRLLETDLPSAVATLDSLEDAGVEMTNLTGTRLNSWERLGNTGKTDDLLESFHRTYRDSYGRSAVNGAQATGDRERAIKLIDEMVALYPSSSMYLDYWLHRALELGERELISRLVDDLLDSCPDCPYSLASCVQALVWMKRHEEALVILRRLNTADEPPSVFIATTLAQHAQSLGETALADSFLASAESRMPESKAVAAGHGWVLANRGKTGEARDIYQKLSDDFPGEEYFRSMLVSTGGSVTDMAGSDDKELASAFDVFKYDFESVDSILAAAETADTMTGSVAVYLQKRTSVLAQGKDRSIIRTRETVLIRDESILEFYQPYNIEFNAADAVPVIRLARVIHRDGSVQKVDPADILITASQSGQADVDESRAVSIPMPGLKAGSILDIIYDEETKSWYSIGWSARLFIRDAFPIMESIVELSTPSGLAINVHATEGVPDPVESETAGRHVWTWLMTDLEAIVIENFALNLFEIYPWVGVSTHASVESSLELYQQDFWGIIDSSTPGMRELSEKITEGHKSDRDKAEAILKHVIESVQYVAIELGRGRFIPTEPDEVFRRGYGDCKDMVALMISLFEAAGMEAEPVLVTDREGFMPVDGLPEPFIYTHVIVHVPEVADLYIDPTAGNPCPHPLPISLSGVPGIAVPRKGKIRRVTLPETDPSQHGFILEADLIPTPDNRARFEITARYRGFMAEVARSAMAFADTTDRANYIRNAVGHGLWETCILKKWEQIDDNCDEVVLKAVLIDTAWVNGQMNSIRFNWKSEVADPIVLYPGPKNKKHAFLMPFPFEDEVILRFHNTSEWIADPIMPVKVKGDGYEGSISSESSSEGDDPWIEVRQKFRMEKSLIEIEEYETFWNDWIRLLGGVYQNYQYRRLLDKEALKKIEEYVEANPEDFGFAFQAAFNIVGTDAGGQGESGHERRVAARSLLQPLIGNPQTGAWSAMLLASIEMNEGRYMVADSVITFAIEAEPSNTFALAIALGIKRELGDLEGMIELNRKLLQVMGDAAIELSLIGALHKAQMYEEADVAITRYYLLHGKQDSTQIKVARLLASVEAQRCDEADSLFAAVRDEINPEALNIFEGSLHMGCQRFEEASVAYEKVWNENPFDAMVCNNLAWSQTLLGRDLERAEELAELSILLSTDKAASNNTLGAIYARRGEWERARETFMELCENDDRPSHLAANEFFLGLCDYYTGNEKEAIERWQKIVKMERIDPDARGWAEKGLDLHSRGESVLGAVFVDIQEEK